MRSCSIIRNKSLRHIQSCLQKPEELARVCGTSAILYYTRITSRPCCQGVSLQKGSSFWLPWQAVELLSFAFGAPEAPAQVTRRLVDFALFDALYTVISGQVWRGEIAPPS